MTLSLYNSLSRKKEEFTPIVEGQVGIYVCGPTVYGPPHLGHAKSYITFDVLVKYFRQYGYKVRYVQNITDVGHLTDDADAGEDKIQKQARLDKVHPWEVVDKWTRQYMDDMSRLHIQHPNFYVRASQHIPEQIEAVEQLIKNGNAYEVNGNVYFEVNSFPEYGKLSGRKLDDQKEAVRVEARTEKRNPRDFALWKKAEPGHILKWNSPWGEGYPGWHIECSVMSTKYLGKTFDIHGGGLENKFPHHECEIAQSESITGQQFCNYWVHNNMVMVDGVKMGKSLGNFKTCEDLLKNHTAEAIRAFLLSTHYRSPSNYTEEAIGATATGLSRLNQLQAMLIEIINNNQTVDSKNEEAQKECDLLVEKLNERLSDDLDTPGAIAAIYTFVSTANKLLDGISSDCAKNIADTLKLWAGDILGILEQPKSNSGDVDIAPIMDMLIELRKDMKSAKKYDVADEIRDRLKDSGIMIEDTKDGTRWKKA